MSPRWARAVRAGSRSAGRSLVGTGGATRPEQAPSRGPRTTSRPSQRTGQIIRPSASSNHPGSSASAPGPRPSEGKLRPLLPLPLAIDAQGGFRPSFQPCFRDRPAAVLADPILTLGLTPLRFPDLLGFLIQELLDHQVP